MSQAPDGRAGEQSRNATPGGHGSRVRSLDAIFELLGDERRRKALYVLYRRAGAVELADLAVEVAAMEDGSPERIACALHHRHLPELAAAGVADYDPAAGVVVLADPPDRFSRYLTAAAEDERESLRRAAESATLSEF